MIEQSIKTSVGKEFAVRLESNPTTGYVWAVSSLPTGVDLLGSEYEKPGGQPQAGDGLTQVFRFRALGTGEHRIEFSLKRQWESQAIQTHAVSVQVG